MTENNTKTNNPAQLVFFVLAFLAGVFATKFWYDFRGPEPRIEVPKEVTVDEESLGVAEVVEEEEPEDLIDAVETSEQDEEDAIDTSGESEEGAEEEDSMVEEDSLISNESEIAIREVLAAKHSKDLEEVTISPQEVDETGSYVLGGVTLGEGPGNFGMFWAYEDEGEWIIAADGNGSPECDVLKDAGFPENMQEGCY